MSTQMNHFRFSHLTVNDDRVLSDIILTSFVILNALMFIVGQDNLSDIEKLDLLRAYAEQLEAKIKQQSLG